MAENDSHLYHKLPQTETSHPDNPIPVEHKSIPQHRIDLSDIGNASDFSSLTSGSSSSDSEGPSTPHATTNSSRASNQLKEQGTSAFVPSTETSNVKKRRASTKLLASKPQDVRRLLKEEVGTQRIAKVCCGGGCRFLDGAESEISETLCDPIRLPDNDAFKSFGLKLGRLSPETKFTSTVELPSQTITLQSLSSSTESEKSTEIKHPPTFVTPHPPYEVYSSKVHHARELTKPGAEKRTFHFDLDVTDYPRESGNVDFVVGGAIGVCAPNADVVVNDILDRLGTPRTLRDKQIICKTTGGRWPTIWGDEQARELITTRRELLTWCVDVQSYPPTKPLLRILAEYADERDEKQILLYLSSAQGQAAFCDLRTGSPVTLLQLLHAFPSSRPPLAHLLSTLNTLMPRFYSLSHDPQFSQAQDGEKRCRLVEIAVTVHETPDWRGGVRTGVGSGFFERIAKQFSIAEQENGSASNLDLRVPMFRGLMANPLAKEFVSDGPMLLIGAGVGVAPFRGFVQRRLKSANCANKVWVLQGIRDSLVDELYSGEWGVESEDVRKVVQSRRGKGRYVQEEVRNQADLVWFIINAIDGRIFVCGSTKGMGEGVESALLDVAMEKGNLNREEAELFWDQKKTEGQYISETW